MLWSHEWGFPSPSPHPALRGLPPAYQVPAIPRQSELGPCWPSGPHTRVRSVSGSRDPCPLGGDAQPRLGQASLGQLGILWVAGKVQVQQQPRPQLWAPPPQPRSQLPWPSLPPRHPGKPRGGRAAAGRGPRPRALAWRGPSPSAPPPAVPAARAPAWSGHRSPRREASACFPVTSAPSHPCRVLARASAAGCSFPGEPGTTRAWRHEEAGM